MNVFKKETQYIFQLVKFKKLSKKLNPDFWKNHVNGPILFSIIFYLSYLYDL